MTSHLKPFAAKERAKIRSTPAKRSVGAGAIAHSHRRFVFALLFIAAQFFFLAIPRADEGEDLYRAGQYAEAIDAWTRLAHGGNPDAAYRLGAIYADGVIVPQDYRAAAKWLELSANSGDPRAMFDLGTLYDEGTGVTQSNAEAFKWYRAAAERGYAPGQFNLGGIYEQGKDVEVDLVEAYKWYTLAAEGMPGFREFAQFDQLEKRLTNAQKQDAIGRARLFQAGSKPPTQATPIVH
jgi:TPR repeat protein